MYANANTDLDIPCNPSVYFTVIKNVSTDFIFKIFDATISPVERVDRKPHKYNKKCDEVFVHFKKTLFVHSHYFFKILSEHGIVVLYYNGLSTKEHWNIKVNQSKHINKVKTNPTNTKKADFEDIQQKYELLKKENYELLVNSYKVSELSNLVDSLNREIEYQDQKIADLKSLLNPELLKIYEELN